MPPRFVVNLLFQFALAERYEEREELSDDEEPLELEPDEEEPEEDPEEPELEPELKR